MTRSILRAVRDRGAVLAAITAGLLLSGCGGASTTASNPPPSPTGQLFVQVDEVSVAQGTTCWVQSVYHPGEGVFFRSKVFDPITGKALSKDDLQSVAVGLPDGESLSMTYAGHPGTKPTDSFWGVLWKVPPDYPTGSVDFTVTAKSNDGRSGKWVPFNVSSSMLTIASKG